MPWILYGHHGEESGPPRPYSLYRTQREATEGASQAAEIIRQHGLGDSHFTVRWHDDLNAAASGE